MKKLQKNWPSNFKLLISGIGILASVYGCKKDLNFTDKNVSGKTDKLVLSKSNFENIYNDLKINGTHVEKLPSFKSLRNFVIVKKESNLEDEIGKQVLNSKSAVKVLGQSTRINTTNYDVDSTILYSAVINELIEDDPLKTLVNESGEILVDGITYKITPFGVLYAKQADEDKLHDIYNKILRQNDILVRITNPSLKLNLEGIDVTVQTNVKANSVGLDNVSSSFNSLSAVNFIDTFSEYNKASSNSDSVGVNNYYKPATNSIKNTSTSDPYGNMAVRTIDFRTTVAGGILRTVFTNSTEYNYFDSKYRVSALLYDRNYGLVKTLGIKVKLQKKGWLWWNKTDAEEIRAGWERIVYEQANAIPKITRPANQPTINLGNSYISPFEPPLHGWFTDNVSTLYKWNFAPSNRELFSIEVPYYLLPFSDNSLTVKSSEFKPLVIEAWNLLENKLRRSVPVSGSNDKDNFKFPVYDISSGSISYLSINDIRKLPLSIHSEPSSYIDAMTGGKYRTYLTPYEQTVTNNDIIDIPLDFSTATVSLSQNLNTPFSISRTFNSLGVSGLSTSYKVNEADVFGTVKHNGRWLGIRLLVNL